MTKTLIFIFTFLSITLNAQIDFDFKSEFKKQLKFSTIYGAVNGGTSLSDVKTFSVTAGKLEEDIITTPYDYSVTFGIRKIARFGYENKANTFYNGTEESWSDNATVGKVKGFEYLFEIDYSRLQGIDYLDQHHFVRYSSDDDCQGPYCIDHFAAKIEYLQNGFADGYNPLEEWILDNGSLHYTYLAIMEGYTVDVYANEYKDPEGNVVANSSAVWEEVVIPQVLADYSEKKRNELANQIQHSIVIGFDYYKYSKNTWLHAWGNLMPYHYDDDSEFSYHKYNGGDQWYDYSGGLIYGIKVNKNLGYFVEGKYNKYWNREWYDFKFGVNYVIF